MVKWIKNEFKSRQSKVKKKNINVIIKQLVSNSMNNFELIEKREENIFHFVKIEKFIVINDKKNWLQNSREENCVVFSHSRNLKLAVWCIWRFALHSFYSTKHSEFVSGLIRFTHLQKIVKKKNQIIVVCSSCICVYAWLRACMHVWAVFLFFICALRL